jgi:hypothetical protein
MAEPASPEGPEPARSRLGEILEQIAEFQAANGIEPLTEDEAMDLAVAETRAVRAERAQRAIAQLRRRA